MFETTPVSAADRARLEKFDPATFSPPDPPKGGKGGEGGTAAAAPVAAEPPLPPSALPGSEVVGVETSPPPPPSPPFRDPAAQSVTGHLQPRGQSTLQRRIQTLCRAMGVETRDTPASNLAFTRSTGLAAHPGYAGAVELCAPVHRLFMGAVRPRYVMTFGSLAHFTSGVKILSCESRHARHGKWKAHRGRAIAFGHDVAFGNVPHMALWASDSRPDVIEWTIAGLRTMKMT